MKILFTAITFLSVALISCNSTGNKSSQPAQIPKALEDKNEYDITKSIRGGYDLVEELYQEIVDKNPELKQLESQIDSFSERKPDSLESFEKFNGKNRSYYSSAVSHNNQIKDSILKSKITAIISQSQEIYNQGISKHSSLIGKIDSQATTLNDLHLALKLIKTRPVIEKFQRDNLPTSKPIESISKDLEKLIHKTDSLTSK